MQVPLQITVRDIDHSAALESRIRHKVAGLERFQSRITSCRVTLARLAAHQRSGRPYEVSVDIRGPGRPAIVASRQHDEDVTVALRDAFDAVRRQLDEAFREYRPDVEPSGLR
jgi:ribosomal subunit interface protein